MPKGEHLKNRNIGVRFDQDNQPTPEAKSNGKKRIQNIRQAIEFFGNQLSSEVIINNEVVELTFESNIAYQLYKKANEGDLKAIELISKVIPNFLATPKVEQRNTFNENSIDNFKTFVLSKAEGFKEVDIRDFQ